MRYKPGWEFTLESEGGGTVGVRVRWVSIDYTPGPTYGQPWAPDHHFYIGPPVPDLTEDEWVDRLFLMALKGEAHEAAEAFQHRGRRPFAPPHGPSVDIYDIRRKPCES